MNLRRSALLLTSMLGCLLSAGCFTVPLDEAGEMKAVMVAGEFRMLVNADLPKSLAACEATFRHFGMLEVRRESGYYNAGLAARTPDDRKVRLGIHEVNSLQSEVRIRVGLKGDRALSRQIFDQIEATLSGR